MKVKKNIIKNNVKINIEINNTLRYFFLGNLQNGQTKIKDERDSKMARKQINRCCNSKCYLL